MKCSLFAYILTGMLMFIILACTGEKQRSVAEINITISVTDEIVVNADTVQIDSLESKLKELGVTNKTNIRIAPDPEASPATIEQVQRRIRIFKQDQN
jgi:biopolymer transport protein ExbD